MPVRASAEAGAQAGAAGAGVAAAVARLAAAGLDLHGWLAVPSWDATVPDVLRAGRLLPGARSALVVGGGGAFLARHTGAAPGADAIDGEAERLLGEEAAGLGGVAVFAHRAVGGVYADFVALARAAGLGWPSRLGLLLHPERGPWLHLRGALLLPVDPVGPAEPDAPLPGPGPCSGCAAPCASACPGAAPTPTGFDVARCAATRLADPRCELRCAARRACPVGAAHAYGPPEEARLMALCLPAVTARAPS